MSKVAFITGANGITGGGLVDYLSENTSLEEWSKIIITSRSPLATSISDSRIHFLAIDFSQPPETLVPLMQDLCAPVTHAYFASYVHKHDFEELQSANRDLFENFLTSITRAASKLQNVTLQTGAKYYNAHLHPVAWPIPEDTPRTASSSDNFYYPQEDFLATKQAGQTWTYNVIRPGGIIGLTHKPNGMNSAVPIAMYILICKELGIDAQMPSNARFWNGTEEYSYQPLLADLTVFVSTNTKCANQAFNASTGDVLCWRYFWPRLCEFFGARPAPDNVYEKFWPEYGSVHLDVSWVEFAGREDSRNAWYRLCERTGCGTAKETFDLNRGQWHLQDWIFQRAWTCPVSITKAREAGWSGYIDTFKAFAVIWERMRELGQLPDWR